MNAAIQNILIFSSEQTLVEKNIVDMIIQCIGNHSLSIDRDLDAFSGKIKRRLLDKSVLFIIFILQDSELDFFITLKDQIEDHALILILPDQDRERISKALKLYPRYITSLDQSERDTHMVIRKIMGNTCSQFDHTRLRVIL